MNKQKTEQINVICSVFCYYYAFFFLPVKIEIPKITKSSAHAKHIQKMSKPVPLFLNVS